MAQASVHLNKPRIAHCFGVVEETIFRDTMLGDRRPDAYGAITRASRVPSTASR